VFVHVPKEGEPKPVGKINNTGWKSARQRAADKWEEEHGEPAPEGFRRVRVHDLKHTFGRRLRAAGVSFEDVKTCSDTAAAGSRRTARKPS